MALKGHEGSALHEFCRPSGIISDDEGRIIGEFLLIYCIGFSCIVSRVWDQIMKRVSNFAEILWWLFDIRWFLLNTSHIFMLKF